MYMLTNLINCTENCPERGAHILHLYDALPIEGKIVVTAILFFILGAVFAVAFYRHNKEAIEQSLKDREGAKQVAEIRNMISTHKKNIYQENVSSYEELLSTLK